MAKTISPLDDLRAKIGKYGVLTLARDAEVSASSIKRFRNGTRSIGSDALERIMLALRLEFATVAEAQK